MTRRTILVTGLLLAASGGAGEAQTAADRPVVIASNLGRPEEQVRIIRFADFNPDDVDMLTLVMVGSSQSKTFIRGDGRAFAFTPRGYAKMREAAE